MVAAVIEQHRDEVAALCRRFSVARLEVFGSAADGTFDPAHSDVDFLVEFRPLDPGPLADAYFGLLDGLRRLFQRKIDLVIPRSIRNPYFLRGVNETRRLFYAA
jgi:uncharacterized protein